MAQTTRRWYRAGLAALSLFLVFSCRLQLPETPGSSHWYIKLNVGPLGSKAISVDEYPVTGVEIVVNDPDHQVLQTINWAAVEGTQSYLIPVTQAGQYEIVVTHISDNNGEPVEATESALFNIAAMVITVIDITPGAIGMIDINGGGSQEPIDLTGWWDYYVKPEGMPELGPAVFYILQEDSELDCSLGFTGTLAGDTIHFNVSFGGTLFEFDATVSDGEIHAAAEGPPFGSVSLRWVPTAATFSHLDMEGTAQGMNIDFSTDFAVAQSEGVSYSFTHTFDVGVGSPWAHFFILSQELIPGHSYTVTDGNWEEDFHLSLQLWDGSEYWTATSGTVEIESYNEFGMSGYFNDVYFPDVPGGGMLSGTFDVHFDQNTGIVTVSGNWAGSSVDIELTTAGSYRNVSSSTNCWVNFEDHELNAGVWLHFPWELPPSLPWTFEEMPSVRYTFVDEGTGFYDLMAESGSVTVNTFSESGASGSFVANFPGGESISGSFDLIFVEGYGIDLPGGP